MRWIGTSGRESRGERGAYATVFVVFFVGLVAAAGVGIEVSHAVFDKSRTQHAADAAAFAIAYDCIAKRADCSASGGDITANEFADGSAGNSPNGGASSGDMTFLDPNAQAWVTTSKNVSLYFGGLFGKPTWAVNSTAKVRWTKSLVGADVPPYAVGICQWAHSPLNVEVTLNGQINGANGAVKSKFSTGNPDWKTLADIEADTADGFLSCAGGVNTPPPGVGDVSTTRTLKSGLWFSEAPGCTNDISNGATHLSIGDIVCAGPRNTEQADKYLVKVGDTIAMAIYAPLLNVTKSGICTVGNEFDNCPGYNGSKPQFPLKIVGFAPFKVSNFNLDGVCPGSCTMGQGFRGMFVGSATRLPGGVYEETDNDFNAVLAELFQ